LALGANAVEVNLPLDGPAYVLGFRRSPRPDTGLALSPSMLVGCLDPPFAEASSVWAREGDAFVRATLPAELASLGLPKAPLAECIAGPVEPGKLSCIRDDACRADCNEPEIDPPAAPECPRFGSPSDFGCSYSGSSCASGEYPLFPGRPCLALDEACASG